MAWQRVIEKYLERYAEPISARAQGLSFESYDAAVVVPVFSESTSTLGRLVSTIEGDGRALIIVVVNAPTNAPASDIARNERFLFSARRSGRPVPLGAEVEWIESPLGARHCDLVVMDVTTGPHRLKAKEGVGRARRMGFDFALGLYHQGRLRSPLCGSSDADVRLPAGYFGALSEMGLGLSHGKHEISGVLFPYKHQPLDDPRERAVMTLLEISFRYYVLGLDYAGSPYAYHSLGSSLAVSLPHYAGVRGVPNRQAGEDFHLLSKLSKLAPLKRATSPTIEIDSRISHRVPFGTGPSLSRALDEGSGGIRFYHPHSFELLRLVLESLTRATAAGSGAELELGSSLPPWARARVTQVWKTTMPLLASCPDETHRLRRLHERFDALSTLQFIHEAHRNGLERVGIDLTFELAPFLPGGLDLEEKLEHCVQKERSLTRQAGLFFG